VGPRPGPESGRVGKKAALIPPPTAAALGLDREGQEAFIPSSSLRTAPLGHPARSGSFRENETAVYGGRVLPRIVKNPEKPQPRLRDGKLPGDY